MNQFDQMETTNPFAYWACIIGMGICGAGWIAGMVWLLFAVAA
jgi:hypothetical protein